MIQIPSQTIPIGSTQAERKRLGELHGFHPSLLADELEASEKQVPSFFIDAYPVTNREFAAFLKATGHNIPDDWSSLATSARAEHPVVLVSADDAAQYARWAGKRLPTPQEYEAAFQGLGPFTRSLPVINDCLPAGGGATGDQGLPPTMAAADDRGPVSRFGVRGFGQIAEWTSAAKPYHSTTFQLLKGPSWICAEAWNLRIAAACWAPRQWRSPLVGFRCAAASDLVTPPPDPDMQPATGGSAPPLADQPAAGRGWLFPKKTARSNSASGLQSGTFLSYTGQRFAALTFNGLLGRVQIMAPEYVAVDGKEIIQWFSKVAIKCAAKPDAACKNLHYSVQKPAVDVTVTMTALGDCCDLDFCFANPAPAPLPAGSAPRTFSASACVKLSEIFNLYDFEGARSFIWFGSGDWLSVRMLERAGCWPQSVIRPGAQHSASPPECPRWITPTILPPRPHPLCLVAVVARDHRSVFGYGCRLPGGQLAFANNFCFTCFHLDPTLIVPAGKTGTFHTRIYYLAGDREHLRRRFLSDFGLANSAPLRSAARQRRAT